MKGGPGCVKGCGGRGGCVDVERVGDIASIGLII